MWELGMSGCCRFSSPDGRLHSGFVPAPFGIVALGEVVGGGEAGVTRFARALAALATYRRRFAPIRKLALAARHPAIVSLVRQTRYFLFAIHFHLKNFTN